MPLQPRPGWVELCVPFPLAPTPSVQALLCARAAAAARSCGARSRAEVPPVCSVSLSCPGAVGLWMLLTPGTAGSGPGTEAPRPCWEHWGLCGPHFGRPSVPAAPYPAVHWGFYPWPQAQVLPRGLERSALGGSQYMQCVRWAPAPLQRLCQALWCGMAAGTPLSYFWAAPGPVPVPPSHHGPRAAPQTALSPAAVAGPPPSPQQQFSFRETEELSTNVNGSRNRAGSGAEGPCT